MEKYQKTVEIRWADLDPNFHMMHSKYYELGAYIRMCYLVDAGITPELMRNFHVGPILFREECIFRREISFGDKIYIDLLLSKSRRDASRWSITHHIYKNDDKLCATINVDGAWLDTQKRKLATLPAEITSPFLEMPKVEGFEWE